MIDEIKIFFHSPTRQNIDSIMSDVAEQGDNYDNTYIVNRYVQEK